MAAGAMHVLGARITAGLVVGPAAAPSMGPLEVMAGAHPVPNAESERAGRRALQIASQTQPGETLVCLLSGGASALMAVPAQGLVLADKQTTTRELLRRGADITAINAVRKHLSAIKGGRLAACSPAGCLTLAISDVVTDDLAVIASGPTVPDPTRFADALAVLERYGGAATYPPAVVAHLNAGVRGARAETPKSGDLPPAAARAHVIGSRMDAMAGAAAAARALGYRVVEVEPAVVGEARVAARNLLDRIAAHIGAQPGSVCVISSGETTVHVTGTGKGGRNQELALALVDRIGSIGRTAAFASVGTDGVDGPTDAAGAVIDSESALNAQRQGLDVADCLARNDSYTFFRTLGDLMMIGPTGTNVGDLQVLVASR